MALQLRLQLQRNAVADEVSAITAVVRPILEGLLYESFKARAARHPERGRNCGHVYIAIARCIEDGSIKVRSEAESVNLRQ